MNGVQNMYSKFVKLLQNTNSSVADVVRGTGIGHSTFCDWKRGDYEPKSDKIKKIADYFGVPLSYFYGEDDNMTVHTINDNHGIIGNANAPITFNAETGHMLNEQEIELLNIFSNLSVVDKAKVIIYASELVKK